MQPYRSHFDRDAQEGLIHALVHVARAGEESRRYVVITSAPSLWLPYCSADDVTLLDVSGIIGQTLWWSESDARDRALTKFRALGWPDSALLLEYKVQNMDETGPKTTRSDLVLADAYGRPLAFVDIIGPGQLHEIVQHYVHQVGRATSGVQLFLTDGEEIFKYSPDEPGGLMQCSFPSPRDLGVDAQWSSKAVETTNTAPAIVIACDTVRTLLTALDQQPNAAVIIDFTFPWGMYRSPVLDRLRDALPETLQSIRFRDAGAAVLGLVAAAQNTGRRVVAIVPPSIAQTGMYASLRKYLAQNLGVAGVIQLPPLPFMFDTLVPPILIALGEYPICSSEKTMFVKLTNRGDIVEPQTAVWWSDVSAGLQGKSVSAGFILPAPAEQAWTGMEEQQEVHAAMERLKQLADIVPLGDLCDVFMGFRHQTFAETRAGVGIPVIRGRDLSSPALTKDDLLWCKSEERVPDHLIVKQGDILIQRIGAAPRCVVVDADLEGAVASNTVYLVRPKDPRANAGTICQFLRSNAGQRLLGVNIQGTGAPTLLVFRLRAVPIPLLPPDTFRDLDELEQVESELRSRADKMSSLRLGLYSAESRQEFQRRLQDYRLLATTLRSSLKQAETLSFQVHNFYPFPLAYSYRLIGSREGTESLYKVQMRVMENIIAFLGSLTLSLIEPERRTMVRDPNPKLAGKLTLQSYWEGGISPGHWRDVCSRGATVLSTYLDNELAVALSSLWAKGSAFAGRIKWLIEAKNDFKHDREPDDEESIRRASQETQAQLDMVMREVAFLTRFPIRLVRDLDTPRGTRTVIVRTLDYIGDHPEHPAGTYEYSMPLTKNDLYIQVRPDLWAPLYPFLTVQTCPTCKTRETYFIDQWRVSGQEALLKSFERGHPEHSKDIAQSLSEW